MSEKQSLVTYFRDFRHSVEVAIPESTKVDSRAHVARELDELVALLENLSLSNEDVSRVIAKAFRTGLLFGAGSYRKEVDRAISMDPLHASRQKRSRPEAVIVQQLRCAYEDFRDEDDGSDFWSWMDANGEDYRLEIEHGTDAVYLSGTEEKRGKRTVLEKIIKKF